MNLRMVSRNRKIVFCLLVIALLSEVSADFVLGSISDKLAIQIQDIQRLIVQGQKRADEQKKALEQAPSSVTVAQAPDGHKIVTVVASVNLQVEVYLSGEIIRTYLLRIVDLNARKTFMTCGKAISMQHWKLNHYSYLDCLRFGD